MRIRLFIIACIATIQSCQLPTKDAVAGNIIAHGARININEGWIVKIDGDMDGSPVNLPHTPRIEPLVVNDQWQGKLTYSKKIEVQQSYMGKTLLHFEGVMHHATVFVNGTKIKEHFGGYLPFSVDLTDHALEGTNEISVEILNTDNSTIPPGKPLAGLDFNYYGGIYRDVWLIRKGDIHITDPFLENDREAGWLLHFDEASDKAARGSLIIQVGNRIDAKEEVKVSVRLSNGSSVYEYEKQIALPNLGNETTALPIEIESPLLWSTVTPNLYDLEIEITSPTGIVYERITDKVGIRDIVLSDDGFFINGEKQFIRGTNRHQEYPHVGYAISNNANYRDALKIKNAGFDMVRLSHYPQDESFLDACDELGLLVMNAIPGWQHYEEGDFVDNSLQDVKDMVRRDRNHPSVVFWEVSLNESGMTDEYMKEANDILRDELPFDDIYTAGWIDHPTYDLFIPARQHAKPPHYWSDYKNGGRNLFIAEYGDWEYYAHNAGFNQTAFEDLSDEERNSRQLRAHGEQRLLQQALNFQEAANSNRKGKNTIGHANWLMFDYNRGYADDLEASGISDIFRIPKFAYYFYQSQRPADETIDHQLVEQGPMVKIASYWTEDSPTDVRVFSNCEEVELYLNDSLIAKQKPTVDAFSDHLEHPPFRFELGQFEPGQLKAIGFIGGQTVVTDMVSTSKQAHSLVLQIDLDGGFSNESDDIVFVYAKVADGQGSIVPSSSHEVTFELNGPGQLIGTNPVVAEAGIATILFRGDLETLNITAISKGLIPITWSDY
ncbi:MAG: glycoside hydrolase family 2 TIM barrel-domain containing protein [Cyclobacteriaceae bacterium]